MKYPFYLGHKKACAPLCSAKVKSALGIESHTDLSVDIVQKSMLWITLLFGTFITFLLEWYLGSVPVPNFCVTFILQVTTLYVQGNAPQNARVIGLNFPWWQAAEF